MLFCASSDPNRFQQVVYNLLSNAIKFTPPNGRIDVEAKNDGLMFELRVGDTGAGFPPDFQQRLFERFQQANPHAGKPGLGLGLSIVRHIVEMHGGMVEGHGQGHKGATFVVRLPIIAQDARKTA